MRIFFKNAFMGTATLLASSLLAGCFEAPAPSTPKPPKEPEVTYSPLNDTGITACGDYAYGSGSGTHNNEVDCVTAGSTQATAGVDADGDPVPVGQDAVYGRDATHNDNSDGHAGFSFTKLDANGDALANQTQNYATNPWACVKDNVTGLIWEVKTDDGGLQDKDHTYTWYNSTGANDGGDHGVGDTGVGTTTGLESKAIVFPGSDNCANPSRCDTEKYVTDVNATNLCGASDWRLPTKAELNNIVSRDRINPAIDSNYFPNTKGSYYESSSPYAHLNNGAFIVTFYDGVDSAGAKHDPHLVRLVRASN